MANQGIYYVEERHRVHGIQRVMCLCQQHFDELPEDMKKSGKQAHGYEMIVRPWNGPAHDCTDCDLAPEFRGTEARS